MDKQGWVLPTVTGTDIDYYDFEVTLYDSNVAVQQSEIKFQLLKDTIESAGGSVEATSLLNVAGHLNALMIKIKVPTS